MGVITSVPAQLSFLKQSAKDITAADVLNYLYENDPPAADFVECLQCLTTAESDGVEVTDKTRERCTRLASGLSDHVLRSFPSPNVFLWNTLHEKARLLEVTLELIPRALVLVREIFLGEDGLAKLLVPRLLQICHTLDVWLDVPDIPLQGDHSPFTLRAKAAKTTVVILRFLGNNLKQDEGNNQKQRAGSTQKQGDDSPGPAGWEILRNLCNECIEACTGKCS
jgi:hypothetical protein